MQPTPLPSPTPREIPAECFNLARLALRRAGRALEFGLPGLPGNFIRLRDRHWQCFNRRLNAELISWRDFRATERTALGAPVACEFKLQHPYGRTLVHRVHDSLAHALRLQLHDARPRQPAQILAWRPLGRMSPASVAQPR